MKHTLLIDESLDCSNQNDVQKIVSNAATLIEIDNTVNLVEELDETNDRFVGQYCQWFFCRMNPECGQSSSSESNYLFMKNKMYGCQSTLKAMTCNQCSNYSL